MNTCTRLALVGGIAATTIGLGAVAGSAAAEVASTAAVKPSAVSGSPLSARLQELARPALADASARERADALSLAAHGAGSLLRAEDGFLVYVRLESLGGGSVDAVRAAGAEIIGVSRQYRVVTASVAPSALDELAAVDGVISVQEEVTPLVHSSGSGDSSGGSGTRATCGSRTSEGDTQLLARQARNMYGLDGSGIKVGMLSDTYDKDTGAPTTASGDVSSGDLPGTGNPCGHTTPVQVLEDPSIASATDEGRAQAQIVHDLAPGSDLAFATGFTGVFEMAQNIRDLRNAGAEVIVDDVLYFIEPMFQRGPIDIAVDDVVGTDVPFFSSAGNNNVIRNGRNVSSLEAPAFREATSCPSGGLPPYVQECMNWSTTGQDSTYTFRVPAGGSIRLVLQWAQPWFGVTTDLDAYLIRGNSELAKSESANTVTDTPYELIQWTNNTGADVNANLVVNRCGTACGGGDDESPRLKVALIQNGSQSTYPTEYNVSTGGDIIGPTIYGHNGGPNTITVGAVPYNNSDTVEVASSRGPLVHYFGPATGPGPAPPLRGPQTIVKPDVGATDCGQNTFFGTFVGGLWRFCGTSASAPHAAAVASLMRDGDAAATVAQIRAGERNTARPVGTFPTTAIGRGLIDARAAVEFRLPKATIANDSIAEGDSGTVAIKLRVHLNKPSEDETTLRYSTGGGTATADVDYVEKTNRLLRIPAGVVNKNISVPVNGDTSVEPNETFNVTLSNPDGLQIEDATGVATITNDD